MFMKNQDSGWCGWRFQRVMRSFRVRRMVLGSRQKTGFQKDEPAFGTIPETHGGITRKVGALVQVAACPLSFCQRRRGLYSTWIIHQCRAHAPGGQTLSGADPGMARPYLCPAYQWRAATNRRDRQSAWMQATGLMFRETFAADRRMTERRRAKDPPRLRS